MELEPDKPRAGAPEWLVTFADLMSLLLTFFVLLLSFSNTEIVKFRTMAGSVRNAFGMKSEIAISDLPMGNNLMPFEDPIQGGGKDPKQEVKEKVEAVLKDSGLGAEGAVEVTERGVLLRLQGDLLFDSGSVAFKSKSLPLLDRLAVYSASVAHPIEVDGHTDDVPIATVVYPSNWELSAARSGSAVRYLAEKGVPAARMRATGHADTVPVAPNETPEGRAKNRRIEILFVIDGNSRAAAGEIKRATDAATGGGGNE